MDDDGLQVDELERRLAAGLRPKLLYTIPDHQNPAGVSLSAERRERARRARAAARLPDRRGRRLPRARLRRRRAAEPVVARPGRRRAGGHDVEDVLPRRAARLGGRAGRGRARSSSPAKQNTDQCAGALGQRLFEEYVRRGWIDEQLAQSRALYRRKCARMLAALERTMPDGVALDARRSGGFFSWLTLPGGATRPSSRGARSSAASASSPARSSIPTAAAATTCACRSAWSTRRRSTRHRAARRSALWRNPFELFCSTRTVWPPTGQT